MAEDVRVAGTPLLAGRSVALVHEWFAATGGSENVFLAMTGLIPHATGYVLWRDRDARRGLQYRESWLAHTPLRHSKPLALPLMPLAWRTLSRRSFDVVISSSHAFAHTVRFGSDQHTRYLSYVHSPARYLWTPGHDVRGPAGLLAAPRAALRRADVRLSRHVQAYAVNSREVRDRVWRYWHRESRVIYPPVDVAYYTGDGSGASPADDAEQGYLLGVGRWVRYKNFELVIAIAEQAQLPLVLAGSGPLEPELRRAAGRVIVPVRFEVRPDRDRLRQLYHGARALLFPAHEDFGIIPVEAMACGCPVVGLRRGGLTETVVDGATGILVDSLDPTAYVTAVRRAERLDRAVIAAHTRRFSAAVFAAEMAAWVDDELG